MSEHHHVLLDYHCPGPCLQAHQGGQGGQWQLFPHSYLELTLSNSKPGFLFVNKIWRDDKMHSDAFSSNIIQTYIDIT